MKAVSIIMSNYFKKDFIRECYESILAQTFTNWELIVIDDTNGKDKLEDVLGNQVNIYLSDDIGLSALRNLGASLTKSEYLLFIDADDKLHPEFLEKTVSCLKENKDIAVAYTDTQHFDGANSFWVQPDYNFHNLLIQNYICSCSLIRRNTYQAVGGFDEDNFNYWEDYEFWINLGSHGFYGYHIPEKLFYYRIHSKSGMQTKRNEILSPVYKSYIITKFPYLYSPEWYEQAKKIISNCPVNFMKWKPFEQENYLRRIGMI